jgi:GNAT superfamily N-acetyltransferase
VPSENTVDVRVAAKNDLAAISEVLGEAAEWMERHRRPHWPADDLDPAVLASLVARNEFVTAQVSGRIIAVMTLQWKDLEFWPDHNDNNAGYLHKLAVRREIAGRGVPAIMVDWAARHVKESTREFLRLDCDLHAGLCAVYERLGFERVDVVTVSPANRAAFSVARYQKTT